MAKWLDMPVIAEGVETPKQYEYLKSIGCDIVQGFLLGKPMPEHEIDKLLIKLL
jgi:EAL domain-containing protein (putative c-di-GMP-specific phosphodiesterase class I)